MNNEEFFNLLKKEFHTIVSRGEKAAFCLGSTTGQLSGLLNNLRTRPMTQEEVYKEVKDIWQQLGMQINEIYYSNKT